MKKMNKKNTELNHKISDFFERQLYKIWFFS